MLEHSSHRGEVAGAPGSWRPTKDGPNNVESTHIFQMMRTLGCETFEQLHRWSVDNRVEFWDYVTRKLEIQFQRQPRAIAEFDQGVEHPKWYPGAKLNIAQSCFQAEESATAIITFDGKLRHITYRQLRQSANRIAHALLDWGLKPGDNIAIDMPMTDKAVAVYLGAVLAGLSVTGIAESFAADEVATRLKLGRAKLLFTQDVIVRGGTTVGLYDKLLAAKPPAMVVFTAQNHLAVTLRKGDVTYDDFLGELTEARQEFVPYAAAPEATTNVLFSSGTTGEPKAIPWSHTTPIKCAADAYFHHDIHPGDVLAWPTSLGWMMGPWLIYASLLNRATLAIFPGLPHTREFGEFVANAKVTMLGVVPSLVKSWRQSGCMQGCDWQSIRCFSSTGECSNAEDYAYLMGLAGNKPVIEYCGGTEIGGGYITGTLVQPAASATFTTPALGLDLVIYDEASQPAPQGEVFIIPPSIGLSLTLLNRDHHEVYYHQTPPGPHGELLRRHGDQIERLAPSCYRAHGRVDDTMNLGGIKVSSAEIEKVLNRLNGVQETAAIAVNPPGGGPSLLVVFAVSKQEISPGVLKSNMQEAIKKNLNPLFKIHEVVVIEALPRTASNKVMRRLLRDRYTL